MNQLARRAPDELADLRDAGADAKRRVTFTAGNSTDLPGRQLIDELTARAEALVAEHTGFRVPSPATAAAASPKRFASPKSAIFASQAQPLRARPSGSLPRGIPASR